MTSIINYLFLVLVILCSIGFFQQGLCEFQIIPWLFVFLAVAGWNEEQGGRGRFNNENSGGFFRKCKFFLAY